jgi:hypothetical protein
MLKPYGRDNKLLLRQAAPGTLFAFFGLLMIATALWRGPVMLEGYFAQRRASEGALYSLIDNHTKEALALLARYLEQGQQQSPARDTGAAPTPAAAGKE